MIGTAIGLFWSAYESYRTSLLDDKVDLTKAQVNLERIYTLFRDSVFYYDLVPASHDIRHLGHKSYEGRRIGLEQIKKLYLDLLEVRNRFKELREDSWYQIEDEWRPAINVWIEEHNESVSEDKLRVEPLP